MGSNYAWERMCPDLELPSSASVFNKERRGRRQGGRERETLRGGLISLGRGGSTQCGLLLRKFPRACGLRPT